jgi:hypothetical protein
MGKLWLTFIVAGLLPLPALLTIDNSLSGQLALLYLGLAHGWLATEVLCYAGGADSPMDYRTRILTLATGVAINTALFIFLGIQVGIKLNVNFPLVSLLAVLPAVGLVPLVLRWSRNKFGAVILSGMLVLACKLTGCVIARLIYGPNYLKMGYASDDWHTARLMISCFWALTTLLSIGGLFVSLFGKQTYSPCAA